jgi:hypothetical protein
MKIKSLFAASAIALASVSSFAGSATFAGGSATIANDAFGAPGSFTQIITFSGLSTGTYNILGNISGQNLSFTSVTLDAALWNITNIAFPQANFGIALLAVTASQPVTLTVKGTSFASAHYNGTISVTPVPEPESYAMLLAGLGLMGAIARRRSNKSKA